MHVNMTNTRSVFIVKFHASHTHTLSLDEDHECVNNSCPLDVLARQRKKDEKREKKPFAKHQVLFVPRVTSPYTHPTAPIESQQNILLVGCFRMVCDQEQGTENQKIKKQSIVDQVQKKKLQSLFRPKKISSLGPRTSRKKISRAFLAKKEKEKIKKNPKIQRNPIHKTPSLFCPSCCIAMHPPPPPLESQQKTCVFWTVCMACDRELAEKGGGETARWRAKKGGNSHHNNTKSFCPLVASPWMAGYVFEGGCVLRVGVINEWVGERRMDVEWRWNGGGMEVEWRWNGGGMDAG